MVKAATPNEKNEHIIELSTVYFFQGSAPKSIALNKCGLEMDRPITGALSALYGYQAKQEAFMAARAYANEHRMDFTVIDFLVKLDQKQNPLTMKPEDLLNHDFFNFQRMAKAMQDEVQESLRHLAAAEGVEPGALGVAKPHLAIMQRPDLLAELIDQPHWQHLKVIAHPAELKFSGRPLNVGTVPFRHWDSIVEATCRLNPNIRITLEAPAQVNADGARPAMSMDHRLTQRAR